MQVYLPIAELPVDMFVLLGMGAAVGFMTWLWLSATVVLVGAELDAEMEHQTAKDSTEGPPKPMGKRGAEVADNVAA